MIHCNTASLLNLAKNMSDTSFDQLKPRSSRLASDGSFLPGMFHSPGELTARDREVLARDLNPKSQVLECGAILRYYK